jgi:hypothetical protein
MARHVRASLDLIVAASLSEAVGEVAELLRVQPQQALRAPAVANFLEMLLAAEAIANARAQGMSLEAATARAAAELGMPSETLRTRLRDARRHATGNAPTQRVKSNPDDLADAA